MASVSSIAAPGPAAATTAAPAAAGIIDIGDPTKMPDHSVSFSDVLSTLNPLQYIPIVGTIYRSITGDKAPEAAQVLGGALLGGPLGLVAAAASAIVEQSSGKDIGQHVVAMLFPQDDAPASNTRYAANTPAAPAPSESPAPATAEASPAAPAPVPATTASAAPEATAPAAQPAPANQAAPSAPTSTLAAAPLSVPPHAASGIMGTAAVGALKPAGAGYSLADYRNFAGSGMPPPPNGNVQRTALVPLQTTIPLPNDVTRAPVVAAAVRTPTNAAPATAAPPTVQPQDTWVSQAMMRGLDRYRDMMRQQEQHQDEQQRGS